MDRVIEVPGYHPDDGLRFVWDEGFEIAVTASSTDVAIKANRAGFVSLARHLLTLAQDGVHEGAHIHLTANQEIDSDLDLILELMPEGSHDVA
ncbi:hypothetical protein [Frankia sp. Cas4]|uniref:Imm32 family immunity protein n=1 Tax=Frankia sp. Cas4 TaxID=3073927 RepID=UPI002AD4694A|nr:hypothetical protein [Frankia sp. Cas4]